MTDEKRQKLCEGLRVCREPIASHCEKAADEIERLAKSLRAAHGYAEECEAKIKMQADQIDSILNSTAQQEIERVNHVKSMLETAADLLERLAHELVATNERLEQLEARIEALERM